MPRRSRPPSRSRPQSSGPASPLAPFHPLVRQWFEETLGDPSEPQRRGWPAIASGSHTLLLAPTGTGKTLAAFLWELNALITDGRQAPLANAVHLLYVSPLKALNNDIQRNLDRPLTELKARFEAAGESFPELRVAVRTGDTPASARARMLRKSPHILITTPESLHILLTSVRGRGMFSALRAVILDEIHAVAGGKRGAHLALTLERLERVVESSPQRIGLSATQRPLEEIARFLGGMELDGGARGPESGARDSGASGREDAPQPESSNGGSRNPDPGARTPPLQFRPVTIVDCGLVKQIEARVESPVPDLGDVGGTIWPSVPPLVLRYIREARTTLIFVNNRAQAERIAARINALANEEVALPYHGSLARERRLGLEQRLKAGELRALVSTSSLELGIDIGSVDVVVQLQSPKRVSSALQRLGRAGHTIGAVSRGVFVPTFRDDGVEILAIVRAMGEGAVEETRAVQNALDVLAQVIVAAVSVDDWASADLFDLVRRAYPYHRLTRAAFDEVLAMLSGKYPSDVAAELEARITWDRVSDRLSAGRGSRLLAVVSGGTIPDRGLYTVNLPDRTRLGELDEEFVHESRVGDVFQLGSFTWRIGAIEHDRVIVTPAPGAPARMPFWHGEYAARSFHLSAHVGELRRELAAAVHRSATDAAAAGVACSVEGMMVRSSCDEATATSLITYAHEQRASTGVVPDDRTLVVEHFRDETGAVRIVLHAPFGGRVNAPWGMALAQRVREALAGQDVQVLTTDDGIMLRLPDLGGAPPLAALLDLPEAEAERRVLEEIGSTSLFGARFRMNAARALLLPRGRPQRRMPLWLQRLKAADLLQTVRAFPSFPILVETYRDVLQDAFDMPKLAVVLGRLRRGEIAVRTAATEIPSPFAASLQFGFVMDWMYGDDAPRAEQRAALLSLDRALLDEVMGGEGADEGTVQALEEIVGARRGTAPGRRARTADELAILLDRAGDATLEELRARVATADEGVRGDPVRELLEHRRAVGIDLAGASTRGAPPEEQDDAAASETPHPPAAPLIILTESYPRYLAALGAEAMTQVLAGPALIRRPAADVVPELLRHATLTPGAARREVLARYAALSGTFTAQDIHRRYGWPIDWIERRLEEWQASGRLLRGAFGGDRATTRWVARRLLDRARRRELATLRRQVEAVELPAFVAFLQTWQHLDPRTRLDGPEAAIEVIRQLYGVPRPAEGWTRDYLPARVRDFDVASLGRLTAAGELVWVGEGRADPQSGARMMVGVRFVARGTARRWIGAEPLAAALGERATMVRDTLARSGASFFADLQAATGLGVHALRDALRELAAAGHVTNDSLDALRDVARWRPLPPRPGKDEQDPTRWLPAGFTPSPGRPVVQRRPNLRRLPKWRRPDREGGEAPWVGRWALVHTPGTLGPEMPEDETAHAIAQQWLVRYGVVARDWWRRERPAVSWRAIYQELKRLEYRGEVRRGYFVRGLAGAQFAVPEAVELLRAAATRKSDAGIELVVMAASDPANAYALTVDPALRPPLSRPRGAGALLVTRAGRVILTAEARGKRISVVPGTSADDVTAAARSLADHFLAPVAGRRRRDLDVETIDGAPASASPYAESLRAAGYRSAGTGLRRYVDF